MSVALALALLGLIFLVITVLTAKKKKYFRSLLYFVTGLLMLSLSALGVTINISIKGYLALTREDLAATVKVEPVGSQQFIARFTLADGTSKNFSLAGDQLYVDAHILKWKPLANFFGLHTSYELDRVAGRYTKLEDETTKVRTVFSLAQNKPLDMFALRQRFSFLTPLLDAEYGSATFINSNAPEEFKLLVSTTGLLIRPSDRNPVSNP